MPQSDNAIATPVHRVSERLVEAIGERRYRMWFDRTARLSVRTAAPRNGDGSGRTSPSHGLAGPSVLEAGEHGHEPYAQADRPGDHASGGDTGGAAGADGAAGRFEAVGFQGRDGAPDRAADSDAAAGSSESDRSDGADELLVKVPNRFVAEWIGRNFDRQLKQATRTELGEAARCRIEVDPETFRGGSNGSNGAAAVESEPEAGAGRAGEAQGRPGGNEPAHAGVGANGSAGATVEPGAESRARRVGAGVSRTTDRSRRRAAPRHRLDDFVVGPANELAYAAVTRLADAAHAEHDDAGVGPIFLHGGCGLGKTHLLQGACDRLYHARPHARILYTTAEQFTNRFLEAIRTNALEPFRRQIRRLDLLAVDDVHFFANKNATQQEFLHSFDAIDMGGARLVMASDSHPRLIKQFSEALISRCVSGLVVEVQPPDRPTRLKLIRAFADRRGLTLRDAAVETLADHCFGSIREIEGLVTRLDALARLERPGGGDLERGGCAGPGQTPVIGHALVERLLSHEHRHLPRRVVRFDVVLDTVAQALVVNRGAVIGAGRQKRIVLARSLTVHLTRKLTSMSYPEIAGAMGRGNHSTIITADRRIRRQCERGETADLPDGSVIAMSELVGRLERQILQAGAAGSK